MKKEDIIEAISRIRDGIGHKNIQTDILDLIYNEQRKELLIIAPDRPEKSLIIGKGGWVVGKLKEDLKINKIHVEDYSDVLIHKHRMQLALARLEELMVRYDTESRQPLLNLSNLLKRRIKYPYDLGTVLEDLETEKSMKINFKTPSRTNKTLSGDDKYNAVVALSGGVDSSFTLIIAEMMGFNSIAVTVDPGDIILPRYYREKVEKLCKKLNVEHRYLEVDMSHIVEGALEGRYHPCGRCSKEIAQYIMEYTQNRKLPFLIYGDLLSTGSQSLVENGDILRINLPAMLSATKGETKDLADKYGISPTGGYGCPLLAEVKKKYNYMNRFSVQRILRETRAGILEPGEALDMVMSLCRNQKK